MIIYRYYMCIYNLTYSYILLELHTDKNELLTPIFPIEESDEIILRDTKIWVQKGIKLKYINRYNYLYIHNRYNYVYIHNRL